MIFREIAFGSDDFLKECRLRNDVLRAPLGLDIHDEPLEVERDQLHFGLFEEDGEMAACVIAAPISSTEAKIRQMAVRATDQGRGLGRRMIEHLETALIQRGFTDLWLNARAPAVGFYEKLGYRVAGEEFIELGLSHLRMEKSIQKAELPEASA